MTTEPVGDVLLVSEQRAPSWLLPLLLAVSASTVTIWVFGLPPTRTDLAFSRLPALNAGLNSAAAVSLVIGYSFIRRGLIAAHRRTMLFALGLSMVFLTSYVWHHLEVGSVRYVGEPGLRSVYLAILIPHVILAACVVPLALVTISRGLKDRRAKHKRLAKVTLPIWLYVSLSGVVVYCMLYR